MRVYIIWGFLGSGKTTLINHLLSTYWVDKRVVIIENESGTTSVDSLLLRSKDYHVRFAMSFLVLSRRSKNLFIQILYWWSIPV